MVGYTLTLTSANTNYRLATLIELQNPKESQYAASITISADSTNAGVVLIGDAALSATRWGAELASKDSISFDAGSGINAESTGNKFARSATAGQVIHVALVTT